MKIWWSEAKEKQFRTWVHNRERGSISRESTVNCIELIFTKWKPVIVSGIFVEQDDVYTSLFPLLQRRIFSFKFKGKADFFVAFFTSLCHIILDIILYIDFSAFIKMTIIDCYEEVYMDMHNKLI